MGLGGQITYFTISPPPPPPRHTHTHLSRPACTQQNITAKLQALKECVVAPTIVAYTDVFTPILQHSLSHTYLTTFSHTDLTALSHTLKTKNNIAGGVYVCVCVEGCRCVCVCGGGGGGRVGGHINLGHTAYAYINKRVVLLDKNKNSPLQTLP